MMVDVEEQKHAYMRPHIFLLFSKMFVWHLMSNNFGFQKNSFFYENLSRYFEIKLFLLADVFSNFLDY